MCFGAGGQGWLHIAQYPRRSSKAPEQLRAEVTRGGGVALGVCRVPSCRGGGVALLGRRGAGGDVDGQIEPVAAAARRVEALQDGGERCGRV